MAAIGLAYQERCLSSTQEREDWKRYEVKGIRDKVVPREDLPICDEIARMMQSKSEVAITAKLMLYLLLLFRDVAQSMPLKNLHVDVPRKAKKERLRVRQFLKLPLSLHQKERSRPPRSFPVIPKTSRTQSTSSFRKSENSLPRIWTRPVREKQMNKKTPLLLRRQNSDSNIKSHR
jgi:hypothetical protein